jgi:hypothetical protein
MFFFRLWNANIQQNNGRFLTLKVLNFGDGGNVKGESVAGKDLALNMNVRSPICTVTLQICILFNKK